MQIHIFIELDELHGKGEVRDFEMNLCNRFQQGGEALLILTAREEQGMIKQLEDKKVPIKKIEYIKNKSFHIKSNKVFLIVE
jgi:hypothetical protein